MSNVGSRFSQTSPSALSNKVHGNLKRYHDSAIRTVFPALKKEMGIRPVQIEVRQYLESDPEVVQTLGSDEKG